MLILIVDVEVPKYARRANGKLQGTWCFDPAPRFCLSRGGLNHYGKAIIAGVVIGLFSGILDEVRKLVKHQPVETGE